jgi:hypothetical protein
MAWPDVILSAAKNPAGGPARMPGTCPEQTDYVGSPVRAAASRWRAIFTYWASLSMRSQRRPCLFFGYTLRSHWISV